MRPRHAPPAAALLCAYAVTGCGTQSPLAPHSPPAREITQLWWWMLLAATIVFLGAVGLLLIAWLRRARPGLPLIGENERANVGLVLLFGAGVPAVVLVALFIVSDLVVIKDTEAPRVSSTAMTIEVTGHQWFWEVRYGQGGPGTTAVTANEIHIPARTRVNVVARTADVIHSFWVPQLNRKVDMVPGYANRLLLYADRPGRYRGQCSELCGQQHAHMALAVFADPPNRFRAWLANAARPRRAPSTREQHRGEQVFLANACSGCHTIRGTAARGDIGPDLTHLAGRTTLAALTIPNRRADLRRWIVDPQHVKPGARMPGLNLAERDREALVAYLESLR